MYFFGDNCILPELLYFLKLCHIWQQTSNQLHCWQHSTNQHHCWHKTTRLMIWKWNKELIYGCRYGALQELPRKHTSTHGEYKKVIINKSRKYCQMNRDCKSFKHIGKMSFKLRSKYICRTFHGKWGQWMWKCPMYGRSIYNFDLYGIWMHRSPWFVT